MDTFIGIDLGTSAAKFLLVERGGRILASRSERYPVFYPKAGWSEQNPEDWLAATKAGISRLLEGQNPDMVRGICFSGQMHGLVALDACDEVIRPCILWNDGRTEAETAYLNEQIGREFLLAHTANIAFAGFTAPKLLWMRRHEAENFARIAKIMLPKDFLVYRLTGSFTTDPSDASGTLLFNVKNRRWSRQMCGLCGISEDMLPRVAQSYEPVGTLKSEYAQLWGLKDAVVVAAGAGDNAAAAVAAGTVHGGDCNISLGTSGTVFFAEDAFPMPDGSLHVFCHANGKYHRMGCILSAASCNAWWMGILNATDYAVEQTGAEEFLGKGEVYFLPYLTGERSPHNDVHARGAFIGLSPTTTRAQMTLAVLEGVCLALKDCIPATNLSSVRVCGGGAKSNLWRTVLANVLGVPVIRPAVEEGPAYGAAMLAEIACGGTFEEVASSIKDGEVALPTPGLSARYAEKYAKFTLLYPALKDSFFKLDT